MGLSKKNYHTNYFNSKMKKVKIIIASVVVLIVSVVFSQSYGQSKPVVCDLTPEEFVKIDKNGAVFLDVRTPGEYNSGHLENAVLIDIYKSDFRDEINKLNKEKKYFVYCKVGARSSSAAKYMVQSGFKDVCNLEGGIIQLSRVGVKIVK
jgi:rhodanese-related sulfurtransferase